MANPSDKIKCKLCDESVHIIKNHLKACTGVIDKGWTEEEAYDRYQIEFDGEPLLSEYAKEILAAKRAEKIKPVEEPKVEIIKEPKVEIDPKEVEVSTASSTEETTKKTRKPRAKKIEEEKVVIAEKADLVEIKEPIKTVDEVSLASSSDFHIRPATVKIADVATKPMTFYPALPTEYKTERVAAHEVLGVDESLLLSSRKEPLMMTYFKTNPCAEYVPKKDPHYVFNDPDLIKDVLMMIELQGMAGYLWGHSGTGKTSIITQIAARLNRPLIRAQHTASTEEAHILGQMLAKSGSTYFEPGLLALAMKHGWIYLADEYDFAFPQILGLYQPVLEGESLIIKEASPEWRRVEPHRYFSLIATGNTNGSGDETGLYQGTNIQNAANFSRFSIVSHVSYMSKDKETEMLMSASKLPKVEAEKFVEFATRIRESYDKKEVSQPVGPRELIHAAKIGMLRGGDFHTGMLKAYINKLPSISATAARELSQRIFGSM